MSKMIKHFRVLGIGLFLMLFTGIIFAQEFEIRPGQLELTVGDTVYLEAIYIDSSENENDTTAAWSVKPHQIASVNMHGMLVAKMSGNGFVHAILEELEDSVEITIVQPEEPVEDELPRIQIVQQDVEMNIGDSLQFSIVYLDSGDMEIDTVGTWSINPNYFGAISETGMFYAELPGECIVRAELDSLTDWVSVIISGEVEDDTGEYNYNGLVLVPSDTVVSIGSQIQFTAHYRAENGEPGQIVDSALIWSLNGMPVGELSQDGLLTATSTGYALVHVALDDKETSAFVIVADSSADTSGLNSITITRDSPNPIGYSVMQELTEGEIWTLGGLPFPMNVLNGGNIYFPVGSLSEDIRIHISLPLFSEVRGDSIGWNGTGVVGGIDFTVIVNDSISEPYYFETPLIVGLVYKRGLLDKLNIDPNSLALYFAIQDGDSVTFDTTGITNTVVDLNYNRIFSGIIHFSSLAIIGENISTGIDDEPVIMPYGYSLEQNYPNPFNPTTSFSYTLPEANKVTISIFDLTGRKIETIVDDYQQAGTYLMKWNASRYSSGIYFYRLSANDFTITKKMVFMK